MDKTYFTYDTDIGSVTIVCYGDEIVAAHIGKNTDKQAICESSSLSNRAYKQLKEYLSGERTLFDLPLNPSGTAFQKKVWQALLKIPYGKTECYSKLAEKIGKPTAARAIGMANNKNPIIIFIPCHRVIGKNGTLVGYAGGIELKKRLLEIEQTL